MIDRTPPNPGPVPHVYVEREAGVCVCGSHRHTGLHVAYDGTPEADLHGMHDQLDRIAEALDVIRRLLRGDGS